VSPFAKETLIGAAVVIVISALCILAFWLGVTGARTVAHEIDCSELCAGGTGRIEEGRCICRLDYTVAGEKRP